MPDEMSFRDIPSARGVSTPFFGKQSWPQPMQLLKRPDRNNIPLAEVGTELNGMARVRQIASPSRARWDGTRILFGITDGNEQISCAISQGALEEIGERPCFSRAADLLECFANARGRIEGPIGPIMMTSEDLRLVPPEGGAPLFGSSARKSTRCVRPQTPQSPEG